MQKYPRGLAVLESTSNVSIRSLRKDPKLWDFVRGRDGESGETLSEKCLWREIKIKTGELRQGEGEGGGKACCG